MSGSAGAFPGHDPGEAQGGGPDAAGPRGHRITRRQLLVAGSGLLAAGGLAVLADRRSAPGVAGVPASGLPSLHTVLAAADATAGQRLLGSPWSSAVAAGADSWGTVYICWLLRNIGIPMTPDATTLYAALREAGGLVSSPRPGALVFYSHGPVDQPYHVGLVTSVTRGVPQTQEGDQPMTVPPEERFVRRFARPWDSRVSYAMPSYG